MSIRPGLYPNWDPSREDLASFGKTGFVLFFGLAILEFALSFFGVLPLSYEAAATFAVVFCSVGAFAGLCGVAVPHTLTPAHLLANTIYWPVSFVLRLLIRPAAPAADNADADTPSSNRDPETP